MRVEADPHSVQDWEPADAAGLACGALTVSRDSVSVVFLYFHTNLCSDAMNGVLMILVVPF